METQRRHLNMHPKLLLDVIKRQAGTLHKAVLEGIMNGIEAGATRVDIAYVAKPKPTLRITDNGKGFEPSANGHSSGMGGNGLASMQRRANALGGSLKIDSGIGRGTNVTLRVPIRPRTRWWPYPNGR